MVINVQGKRIINDPGPRLVYGSFMAPARYILPFMGYNVKWCQDEQLAVGHSQTGPEIRINIKNRRIFINNQQVVSKQPVLLIKGHIFIPITTITDRLGYWAQWNPETSTLNINHFEWDD
ncbi:MAG: copper amine oxidase N-terminal domain-containing protein [Candidatus Saccharibacteria bacterium]